MQHSHPQTHSKQRPQTDALQPSMAEQALAQLGIEPADMQGIKDDGYVLLERENARPIMALPSHNLEHLLLTCPLFSFSEQTDYAVLAYALQLNLCLSHIQSAAIGFDANNRMLCLRYSHDLADKGNDLSHVLNNVSQLAQQVSEHLETYYRERV